MADTELQTVNTALHKPRYLVCEDLQNYLVYFYRNLVEITFPLDDECFRNQVHSVPHACYVSSHVKSVSQFSKPWMKFSLENVRCAFLLRYSVLNTLTLVEHFDKFLENNQGVFNELLSKNTVRICCLGGGQGTEIVAIVRAIDNFLQNEKCEVETDEKLKLCFTILDPYEDWSNWILKLVKKLRVCGVLCKSDKIDVRVRFKQVDFISESWNNEVLKAIRKSDFLTTVKFLSLFDDILCEAKKNKYRSLLSSICQNMKMNSLIFFLDFAGGKYYPAIDKHMINYPYFEKLFFLNHHLHIIDICASSEKTFTSDFLNNMMVGHHKTLVSSAAWQKCVPKVEFGKSKKKIKANTEEVICKLFETVCFDGNA